MKITMLVSISATGHSPAGGDGLSAKIGQTLDVDADTAQEFIANGWAVAEIQVQSTPASPHGDAPLKPTADGHIDLADGVDDTEATLAGKALARRRKGA